MICRSSRSHSSPAALSLLKGEKEPCAPAELKILSPREAELTLTEGRYHQVRRMLASQGCEVVALHRRRFGHLELGDLPTGQWRELPLGEFDRSSNSPIGFNHGTTE